MDQNIWNKYGSSTVSHLSDRLQYILLVSDQRININVTPAMFNYCNYCLSMNYEYIFCWNYSKKKLTIIAVCTTVGTILLNEKYNTTTQDLYTTLTTTGSIAITAFEMVLWIFCDCYVVTYNRIIIYGYLQAHPLWICTLWFIWYCNANLFMLQFLMMILLRWNRLCNIVSTFGLLWFSTVFVDYVSTWINEHNQVATNCVCF